MEEMEQREDRREPRSVASYGRVLSVGVVKWASRGSKPFRLDGSEVARRKEMQR